MSSLTTNNCIKEFQNEHRWLSNFFPVTIAYNGRVFKSVEHAYMSEKNTSEVWKDFCMNEEDPKIVKKLSEEIKLRENWDTLKLDVMRQVVKIKFSQEPFKTQLLETGDTYLQEGNTWDDIFWGVDLETGKGENNLGKIIMEIRTELK